MESTTLNTYTAPMYIVELLTKILNAVGNITGGDGTDLEDIKTSISNIDIDTNDMNSKLTNISTDVNIIKTTVNEDFTNVNTQLTNLNTVTGTVADNISTNTVSVNTVSSKLDTVANNQITDSSKLDTINTSITQVQSAITSLQTELETTETIISTVSDNIAEMHSVMNPKHLFAVTAGDSTFAQPAVLKNITESIITLEVLPAGGTEYISTTIYPGWNCEIVTGVKGATENILQYGY